MSILLLVALLLAPVIIALAVSWYIRIKGEDEREELNWWLEGQTAPRMLASQLAGQCEKCGKKGKVSRCSNCRLACYCSRECQRAAWKSGHKLLCMQHQQKSAAAAAKSSASKAQAKAPNEPEGDELAPVPTQVLYPYSSFLKLMATTNVCRDLPVGLQNCGNTCFANALLQCLLHSQPFIAYLRSGDHTYSCSKPSPSAWCLLCELQDLAEQVEEANAGTCVSPHSIVRHVRKIAPHLSPGRQEDSHDLYLAMLDLMESIMLHEYGGKSAHPNMRTRETTLMGHCFGGYVRFQTVCSECGHISQRFDTKAGLELEVSARVQGRLEGALDALFADEELDEDNKYKCDKCKCEVLATRRSAIEAAPNLLALCLKRFGLGRFGKNNRRVAYGATLDLEPYMAEDAMDAVPATYTLYGVIVHVDFGGSTAFGHYIAYVKIRDGRWYLCDDGRVQEVEEEEALSQVAYMLFYQRNQPRAAPDPGYVRRAAHAAASNGHYSTGSIPDSSAAEEQQGDSTPAAQQHVGNRENGGEAPAANAHVQPRHLGTVGSWGSDDAGQEAGAASGAMVVFAGMQLPREEWGGALPEPLWRMSQLAVGASSSGGDTLVVSVELPGVSSLPDIQVGVLNRQLLVRVPHRYLLALEVPEVGLQEDTGQSTGTGTQSPPSLVPLNVVFKRASARLKVVLGCAQHGQAIAYDTLLDTQNVDSTSDTSAGAGAVADAIQPQCTSSTPAVTNAKPTQNRTASAASGGKGTKGKGKVKGK